MEARYSSPVRPLIFVVILAAITAFIACSSLYTVAALSLARSRGVFETPQQGVMFNASRTYCGLEKVEIEQAATNSFDGSDPHVWYVMYTVYASSHAPCNPERSGPGLYHQSYERGGTFYLNVKDGWVMIPEGMFPQFIGYWMKKLSLAGPGDSTHVERGW
jgi:hypothetical protein